MNEVQSRVPAPLHEPAGKSSGRRRWLGRLARLLLGAVILGGTVLVSSYWLRNRPRVRRRRPRPAAALVEVTPVRKDSRQVMVRALGTVIPARRVVLAPRVSGQVTALNPNLVPGGLVHVGDELITVDPADYDLAVSQREAELERLKALYRQVQAEVALRESDLAKAEANLKIELGRQAVARKEYRLLGEAVKAEDLEWVLRKPELEIARSACAAARAARSAARAAVDAAQASLRAAEAALAKARLDRKRTVLRAPFNALVVQRHVELGALVSPSTPTVELVGADCYWVELTLPVDRLRWIHIPRSKGDTGSAVRIYHRSAWGAGRFRRGRVLRLAAEVEPKGRLARLLVAVPDPLGLKTEGNAPSLILGTYVRAEIEGRAVEDVAALPPSALHEGNTLWLLAPDSTLEMRRVRPVWSGPDRIYVGEELREGELLITSDLPNPVAGMKLRVAEGRGFSRPMSQPRSKPRAITRRGGRTGE